MQLSCGPQVMVMVESLSVIHLSMFFQIVSSIMRNHGMNTLLASRFRHSLGLQHKRKHLISYSNIHNLTKYNKKELWF